ncbi:MAG: FRG domain-containing protein [Bacilli bacterium]|nr:FRG domain-containing protein [Bacilli bacterium]
MQNDRFLTSYLNEVLLHFKSKSAAKISVFTEKNQKYDDYILQYKEYFNTYENVIFSDFHDAISEYSNKSSKNNMFQSIEGNLNSLSEKIKLRLVINIHVFFRLYKMKNYTEKPLNNIEDIIKYDKQEGIVWYRGQTNANWQLIPSFFRNAKESFLWTWKDIYNDYNSKPSKVSLIKKLNEVDINTATFPYKTAAFIQHSIGYSPLIDFTRSPTVAISFALSNGSSMVSYYGDTACVFVLELDGYEILSELDDIDKVLSSSKTQVFKRNELIINLLTNKMWIDLMVGTISSTIHLINKPTNDRMMFQKGTFILYDNVIIIGDEVFMSYNKISFIERHLTKYNIEVKFKEKLYENLMIKYPQYHQRYLLDPYLYLGEPDK